MNVNEIAPAQVEAQQPAEVSRSATRPKKGAKVKPSLAAGAPGVTLGELAQRYLEHLEAQGRSRGTLFSYGIELKTAGRELGGDRLIADLTPEQVLAYFNSPKVIQLKSGRPKARPSIDKTRRVLRLALVWAVAQGWLAQAPLPQTPQLAQ